MAKKISTILAAVALATILVLSACSPKEVEDTTLKIGSLPRILDLPAFVANQEKLYEANGITVEIVSFRSSNEMSTAMITGELDGIIQGTYESVNLNKEEKTSKFIASCVMPRMFEVVAASKSGITSVEQLKGKDIATAVSNVMDYSLDKLLARKGIDSKDVEKVNVPIMPLRLEALVQSKVSAAILTPPLSDFAVSKGAKVVIEDIDQPFGGPGLIFSLKALEEKPNTIGSFVKSWQQAVDLINTNPSKYHSLLAEIARVPEDITDSVQVPAFPALGLPNKAEIESVIDWMIANGIVDTRPVYDDIVETRYLK